LAKKREISPGKDCLGRPYEKESSGESRGRRDKKFALGRGETKEEEKLKLSWRKSVSEKEILRRGRGENQNFMPEDVC